MPSTENCRARVVTDAGSMVRRATLFNRPVQLDFTASDFDLIFALSTTTMKPRPDDIIKDRKIDLCPATKDCSVSSLVKECSFCGIFLLYCCSCENKHYHLSDSERPRHICHHYRIVFTDGACSKNGRYESTSGVGIAYGTGDDRQMSVPITDSLDPYPLRSSQRAELLAAKLGLKFLADYVLDTLKPTERLKDKSRSWLIATDSEYVVKGMTEWLPRWKVRFTYAHSPTKKY